MYSCLYCNKRLRCTNHVFCCPEHRRLYFIKVGAVIVSAADPGNDSDSHNGGSVSEVGVGVGYCV